MPLTHHAWNYQRIQLMKPKTQSSKYRAIPEPHRFIVPATNPVHLPHLKHTDINTGLFQSVSTVSAGKRILDQYWIENFFIFF